MRHTRTASAPDCENSVNTCSADRHTPSAEDWTHCTGQLWPGIAVGQELTAESLITEMHSTPLFARRSAIRYTTGRPSTSANASGIPLTISAPEPCLSSAGGATIRIAFTSTATTSVRLREKSRIGMESMPAIAENAIWVPVPWLAGEHQTSADISG